MYEYIIGKITYINPGFIALENSNIGYKVYVSNPYSFKESYLTSLLSFKSTLFPHNTDSNFQ